MKCDNCKIQKSVNESKEPACCAWFMENVVCMGKSIDECTEYEKIDNAKT